MIENNILVKIIRLFEELEKVEVTENNTPYMLIYNGHSSVDEYLKHIKFLFNGFRDELWNLPYVVKEPDNRLPIYQNLLSAIKETKMRIDYYYKRDIFTNYFYTYLGEKIKSDKFPDYKKENYTDKSHYQHHKVHFIYELQLKMLNDVIRFLDIAFIFENGNIKKEQLMQLPKEPPVISQKLLKETKELLSNLDRIDSKLGVEELAPLQLILHEHLSDKPLNKSNLSRIISQIYSTPKAEEPKANQIYNAFFDLKQQTKDIIKKLLIDIINDLNKDGSKN